MKVLPGLSVNTVWKGLAYFWSEVSSMSEMHVSQPLLSVQWQWKASHSNELHKMHITFPSLFCTEAFFLLIFLLIAQKQSSNFFLFPASNKVLCCHLSALQTLLCIKMKKQYLLLRFSDTAPHSGGNC